MINERTDLAYLWSKKNTPPEFQFVGLRFYVEDGGDLMIEHDNVKLHLPYAGVLRLKEWIERTFI